MLIIALLSLLSGLTMQARSVSIFVQPVMALFSKSPDGNHFQSIGNEPLLYLLNVNLLTIELNEVKTVHYALRVRPKMR